MPKEEGGYELISKAGRYISTSSLTPDPDAQAVGAPYEALLAAYNNKAIGQTAVPLDALRRPTRPTCRRMLQSGSWLRKASRWTSTSLAP